MEPTDPSQTVWMCISDHRACTPVSWRQTDTTKGQTPCFTSLTKDNQRFAPTNKCKMCFEADGSGELPYEMNYLALCRGGGPLGASAAEPSRLDILGAPGPAGHDPKALLIPRSCKPHLVAWWTDNRRWVQISSRDARTAWKTCWARYACRYFRAPLALMSTRISSLGLPKQCQVKPQENLLSLKLVHTFHTTEILYKSHELLDVKAEIGRRHGFPCYLCLAFQGRCEVRVTAVFQGSVPVIKASATGGSAHVSPVRRPLSLPLPLFLFTPTL